MDPKKGAFRVAHLKDSGSGKWSLAFEYLLGNCLRFVDGALVLRGISSTEIRRGSAKKRNYQ